MKPHPVCIGSTGAAALQLVRADTPHARMRGLLGRAPLAPEEALLLRPCRLVHTFGMAYAIDIVFLNRAGVVCRVARTVPPGRFSGCLRAWQTLELAAGGAHAFGIQVGDALTLDEKGGSTP